MKLGGNAAAGLGLGVRVGSSAASAAKYTTKLAFEYKSSLANKVAVDQRLSPRDPLAVVDLSSAESLALAEEATANEVEADDVKPKSLSAPTPTKAAQTLEPEAKPTALKPVVLDSSPTPPLSAFLGGAPKKPLGKPSKLGAVATGADFSKIEIQAKEEKELEENLKTKAKEEEEIVVKKTPIASETRRPSVSGKQQKPAPVPLTKEQEAAMGRLGMGMKKMNLQAGASDSTLSAPPPSLDPTKSISSDHYFKQETDEERLATQEKLRQTRGQTSISSSDFFAHPEDHEDVDHGYNPSGILRNVRR